MFKYSMFNKDKTRKNCYILFEEILDGVFYVAKSRWGGIRGFVNTETVVDTLNNKSRVAILKTNKSIVTNFDINKKQ